MKFAGGCFALVLATIVSRSALVRAGPPPDCSEGPDPSGCLIDYTNLGTAECTLECCESAGNPLPQCCTEVMKECDDANNTCAPSVCTCMGDEAVRYTNTPGSLAINNIQDPIKNMECTSNDVRIARARVISINGSNETENAKCTSGDILNISLRVDLVSGATSRRSEIGIWTSTTGNWVADGMGAESGALSGSCDHSFFYNRTDLPDLDRLVDVEEADNCGDIAQQETYLDLPLKTSETSLGVESITVKCQSTDSSELLTVPSCISWKQPGEDDKVCDLDYDADGMFYPDVYDRQDYIYATLPGTKSKCRCSNDIVLNITVVNPSDSPSANPSENPSAKPSANPSESPSAKPSLRPSSVPSHSPSAAPSSSPSESPSDEPSSDPSLSPSETPSASPSTSPSAKPSANPSESPSAKPSLRPSSVPSHSPSAAPSSSPSESPSDEPSSDPSLSPSETPSASPSTSPSAKPSANPSESPSAKPSLRPSSVPSQLPSSEPSSSPSESPSDEPSSDPSLSPSATPSASPSASPSEVPSPQPSESPSESPSSAPSSDPTAIDPCIDISKNAEGDDSQQVRVGDDAIFTITVNNCGDVNLTNVVVTDPLAPNCNNTFASLAVNATETYNCTVTVTEDFTNVATATGDDPNGDPVDDSDPSTVDAIDPCIDISKNDEGDDSQQVRVGDDATFTITVKNCGDVDLTNVVVTDPLAPNCDNNALGSLAVGATQTYTCTMTVTEDFTNVATATGDDPNGDPVDDSDPSSVDAIDPCIDISKNAEGDDSQQVRVGDDAIFTITVNNCGDVNLTNVVVTDPLAPNCNNTFASLAVNATETYNCTVTVTEDFTNVATATGDDPNGDPVDDSDPSTVDAIDPCIDISKNDEGDDSQQVRVGDDATFTITVKNCGDVDLTNVVVTDPLAPNCDNNALGSLAVGATQTYTCTMTVTEDFTNVATATGDDPNGDPVDDSDPSSVDAIDPCIDISKNAEGDDSQQVRVGDDATFTITVKNCGDVDLTNVVVTDPLAPNCNNTFASLAVNATETYNCTVTVTEDFTNVATATGDDPNGDPVDDSDPSTVDAIDPCIDISKNDEGDDSQQVRVGDDATFTITVKNCGDVDLTNVVVTDPLAPNCDNNALGSLAVGATQTYTCTMTVTEDFTNVATATGDDPNGDPVDDSDPSSVDAIDPCIDISKNAEGDDSQQVRVGDDATFTITVKNCGDVDLTNVVVTDPLAPNCNNTFASLAVNATETYNCTVTVTEDFTNVATATGDDPNGDPVDDSDPSTVDAIEPCEVLVEKTCAIVPSTEPEVQTCADLKPVTQLTMIWNGTSGVNITTQLGEMLNDVQNGDVITFQANTDGGNDFGITLSGSVSGSAEFHLSCSDDDMDGYDDCGKNQGNGKSNVASLINDFLFGGMTGVNGQFTCPEAEAQTGSSEFPEESDKCDFVAPEEAASCSDLKPVTHLTMVWNGTDNVNMTTDQGEVFNDVQNGDVITFQVNGDLDIQLTGSVNGVADFHVSCSDDDLNGPEDCGKPQGSDNDDSINAFLFGGMRGENGEFGCPGIPLSTAGTDVIYGFRVINPNDRNLTVQIVDATLGINQTATVPANDTVEVVTDAIYILPDGTNVFNNTVEVTAVFETGTGAGCSASDSVQVERIEPSAPTDTEGCFGWAYTTSNCMKGTYGQNGLDDWICDDDGNSVQCGGDGDRAKWVDDVDDAVDNDPINCSTSVSDESLKRMPAKKDEGNACPDSANTNTRDDHRDCPDPTSGDCVPVEVTYRTTEESDKWKKSPDGGTTASLLTQLDCIDISFENRVECDTSNSGGGCDMADGGIFQTCTSDWYAACNDDKCYSESGCSSENEITCPFDSDTDGKARYKITFTVKNTVDCARCWISTASVFLYDYTSTTNLNSTTMCPLDENMDSLSEVSAKFEPLPKTVNLYPENKMEVFSAAAYLWCGAVDGSGNNIGNYMDNNGIFKTMFKNKKLCDPDESTLTNLDDMCEVHKNV